MKKNLLTLLIILLAWNCGAQDQPINIGHIDSIYSEILQEDREIWIHLPASAKNSMFNDTYPVLYLLDGDAHFHSVTGLIQQLSTVNGNTEIPEMIVVALPNTDRVRDMTPTNAESVETSGGSAGFLDFIEKELMPFIENNYPVANNKTFVGHSLGGLMVIDALLHRPDLFNNYIAIDPSLWWDDQFLLKKADSILTKATFENKSLYVGVANTMNEDITYATLMTDTTEDSRHMRSILKFIGLVEDLKLDDANFNWKYYADDTHGSVPLITEHDALRFMYSWFECACYRDVFSGESSFTGEELVAKFDEHFAMVSAKMGFQAHPSEYIIHGIANWFSWNDETEKAFAFFNLNIRNFPVSYHAYDAMGDYYIKQKDRLKASEFFKKSLELGAGSETKAKLSEIEIEK
jgi:predicted alpha/beta superfamily hydrolase